MKKISGSLLICCLVTQGCSSRPRNFEPTLVTVPADQRAFDTAYANCREAVLAGRPNSTGKGASVGAGAKAGAGTAAIGGTAAALAGGWGGAALAASTVVLLPFAIVGGAVAVAHAKRAKKERVIRAGMESCLREQGYQVAGWSKAIRHPTVVGSAPTGSPQP